MKLPFSFSENEKSVACWAQNEDAFSVSANQLKKKERKDTNLLTVV